MTGASGLIGRALVRALGEAGHDVVRLVRRPARAADEVTWDPSTQTLDTRALGVVDGAVNLGGAGVGDHRWTTDYKREIHDSRVLATRTLVTALAGMRPLPSVLVSASAVGFYGSRGEDVLTEASGPGDGFLAGVVRDWEAEAVLAADAGIRVVTARTGLVLSSRGGALQRMLPPARLGVAGPFGRGRQWWPWITLADEVAALRYLLDSDVQGPVNLACPQPARNREVVAALGRTLHRPAVLPVPPIALHLALGEFAGEILASRRMVPQRLLDAGFPFAHDRLDDAMGWVAAGN